MKTARLYDLKNLRHAGEIPLAELAPGHILAEVKGVEGRVWVRQEDLEDLRRRQGAPAIRHPPLDETTRQRVQWFAGVLAEFEPLTTEAWEDRLRREIDLERELTRWTNIAEAYSHFTGGKTLPARAAPLSAPVGSTTIWRVAEVAMEPTVTHSRDHMQPVCR